MANESTSPTTNLNSTGKGAKKRRVGIVSEDDEAEDESDDEDKVKKKLWWQLLLFRGSDAHYLRATATFHLAKSKNTPKIAAATSRT